MATGEAEPLRLKRSATRLGHTITATAARNLYTTIGEHDLAIDALLMWPRPTWLETMCGPHPLPPRLGELTNHLDVADTSEWGHSA